MLRYVGPNSWSFIPSCILFAPNHSVLALTEEYPGVNFGGEIGSMTEKLSRMLWLTQSLPVIFFVQRVYSTAGPSPAPASLPAPPLTPPPKTPPPPSTAATPKPPPRPSQSLVSYVENFTEVNVDIVIDLLNVNSTNYDAATWTWRIQSLDCWCHNHWCYLPGVPLSWLGLKSANNIFNIWKTEGFIIYI